MIFVLISCISFMVYHYLHYGIVVCAQDLRLFIILNNVSCESNPVWLPIKHEMTQFACMLRIEDVQRECYSDSSASKELGMLRLIVKRLSSKY